jgi:uncharacterized membrane protein
MGNNWLNLKRLAEVLVTAGLITMVLALASCKHRPFSAVEDEIPVPTGGGGGGGGGGISGIPCDSDTVYFQNTILPLFVSNCAKSGCHDAITHEEGIILDSYANIMATGQITPFDPWDGDIMEVITETDPDKIMPPPGNGSLTSQQINLIAQWISQGAQNNGCELCDTLNVTYSAKVKPLVDLKCKGCHSGSNPSYGINLSTHAGLQAIALNGSLTGSIQHAAGYYAMPKGTAKMPPCEIALIRIWVNAGAPNN